MLVYVWSHEEGGQTKGKKPASQDALVPWSMPSRFRTGARTDYANEEHKRYYHLFKEGELEILVKKLPGCVITASGFDHENWWVLVTKATPAAACSSDIT